MATFSKINELIQQKLPSHLAKLVTDFAKQYFANVPEEDLKDRTDEDLFASMLSHWNLNYQRPRGETRVHLYNPTYEVHGWHSPHTIVEVAIDDMPFLVDSLRLELQRQAAHVHFMIYTRGGLNVRRDKENKIVEVIPPGEECKDCFSDAPIYIEIDKKTNVEILNALQESLLKILNDVKLAVTDWEFMRNKMKEMIEELRNNPPPVDKEDIAESILFLEWLNDDHFTYLGCRDYEIVQEKSGPGILAIKNTGVGVLRNEKDKPARLISSMPPAAQALALSKQILVISKTNTKATVHRPTYTDYIGIKRFDKEGNVVGERRFIGLYTSTAYKSHPKDIPFLRRKVELVMKNAKLSSKGHSGKTLLDILASLPRDDLFQATAEELTELALKILYIHDRSQIRLFIRSDAYQRFVSCLVFIPRERLDTELCQAIENILFSAFQAKEISYSWSSTESILVRVDYLIRIDSSVPLQVDAKALENKIIDIARSWEDSLRDYLVAHEGDERGMLLINRYAESFPASYKQDYDAQTAVYDIRHIEHLLKSKVLQMNLYHPISESEGYLRFKLFQLGEPIVLSDAVPILENMGMRVLDERPYEIKLKEGRSVWIHDIGMNIIQLVKDFEVNKIKENFQQAFFNIWHGEAENDGFNRLITLGDLTWREAALIRGYGKYLRQAGFTFSQAYIEVTLAKNAAIATQLVAFFKLRFNSENQGPKESVVLLEKEILQALENVSNLDEDRILRKFLELMYATLRTNYFQKDTEGHLKSWISFKLNPKKISDLSLPRPMFEIFVYSPRVEGVHLRSAKVARGGIRWSDRREDFRMEVLGLMKAQQVKNAVIVPSGAKGGFITKCLKEEASREAMMAEGVACYQIFIRGLLDITDNFENGKVISPKNTICYDDDDYYLVVAADKGTATFSDYANQISQEYEFWLGDAFASGGSAGYDHKKIGITARGAWESVKRHFHRLGIDPESQDFTVVGIGDMSGDVFGNGMLRSRHIKLVAAFDHRHIFLDPNPDAEKSFKERERIFNLPRSSWEDYNLKLISKGGGIFKRSAKSISLSAEIRKLLDIAQEQLEPNLLVRSILMAKVDLLWNGGIGTYVKSTQERHADVSDRSNDAVRVNGSELKCRAVAEGGNLGFTQLARVEYAAQNGYIYTDFIDNSAGVDCSDHEVNCKILLNPLVASGDMTLKQRNDLLVKMTDDIARLVLADNYCQTRAIDMIAGRANEDFELHRDYLESLVKKGKLDRELEYLPTDKNLLERRIQNKSLYPPEIAVLIAYTKIVLKTDLLKTDIFEDPVVARFLESEFPEIIVEKFPEALKKHGLKNEIIATQFVNRMVNDMGMLFAYRMETEVNAGVDAVARAYITASKITRFSDTIKDIEQVKSALIPTEINQALPSLLADWQYQWMNFAARLVRRSARWFLRTPKEYLQSIEQTVQYFSSKTQMLMEIFPELIVGDRKSRWEETMIALREGGIAEDLAKRLAYIKSQYGMLDIIEASTEYGIPLEVFAKIYFELGERLDFSWLREQIMNLGSESRWGILARASSRDDLDYQQRELALNVLQNGYQEVEAIKLLDQWMVKNEIFVLRWQSILSELRATAQLESMMVVVAVRELTELTKLKVIATSKKKKRQVK